MEEVPFEADDEMTSAGLPAVLNISVSSIDC